MPDESGRAATLSAPRALLLACPLFIACSVLDSGKESGADFNPLPDSAEYVYSKEIGLSSGMGIYWNCSDTVYRTPLREARTPGGRRFVDSTTVQCKVVGADSGGVTTTLVSKVLLDTVAFQESAKSLVMTGADAFLNVALPAGSLSGYPDGLRRKSILVTGAAISFPKRNFPTVRTPTSQDANEDCNYVDGDRTTSCRELYAGDFRYTGESVIFLPNVGLVSVSSGFSSAPLGSGPTQSGIIRLLYRVKDGDTLSYGGSLHP